MVRFVHIKMSGGRARTTTYRTLTAAKAAIHGVGGCIHKVYYGSRGLVRRMVRLGCYSPSPSFAGYSKTHRKARRVARRSKRSR